MYSPDEIEAKKDYEKIFTQAGPCEVEETVIMLFSGAVISLAAWGHWLPEHSWPCPPACLPARLWLTVCTSTCLSAWVHVCFSACQIICLSHSPVCRLVVCLYLCVCVCVSKERHTLYPRDQALVSETARQIIGASGRLLGLVLSPAASQFLLFTQLPF